MFLHERSRSRSPCRPCKGGAAVGTEQVASATAENSQTVFSGGVISPAGLSGDAIAPNTDDGTGSGWISDLMRSMGTAKALTQIKPLVVSSMHTGMNTHHACLLSLGISCLDTVGAEIKDHARAFVKRNNICPATLHRDSADMLREAVGIGEPGYRRADIFADGFPCQPFSSMNRKKHNPESHPLYREFKKVVDYMNKTEPITAVLENVVGFVRPFSAGAGQTEEDLGDDNDNDEDDDNDKSDGVEVDAAVSGWDLLKVAIGDKYHLQSRILDMKHWVDIRRPRVFIWCLHKEFGSEADLSRVLSSVDAAVSKRASSQPESLEQYTYSVHSTEWSSKVALELTTRGARHTARSQQKKAYQKHTEQVRDFLRERQTPWAEAQPLARARLLGLVGTDRQREVLNCVLLAHCYHTKLDPRDELQLAQAKVGLRWDISQNFPRAKIRQMKTKTLGCACTSALIYSFEHDRLFRAEELLRVFGWQTANCDGISESHLMDLIGESQAMQPLAVALWSLILNVGGQVGWVRN